MQNLKFSERSVRIHYLLNGVSVYITFIHFTGEFWEEVI